MSILVPILIAAFLGGVGSLAGGVLLLFHKKLAESIPHVLVPFAAGALLSTAFFDLIPEAVDHGQKLGQETDVFFWVLIGIFFFYLLDRSIHWFQYHRTVQKGVHKAATVPLIILGDSVHNFIDGVAIAVTFLINPALGVVTTLATAAHELPQEIGDFAVLLHEGLSRKKVFLYNFLSALLSIAGALLTVLIGGHAIELLLSVALPITAGFFVYIALAKLLPEIHHEEKKGYAIWETVSLFFGAGLIWLAITLLEHGN